MFSKETAAQRRQRENKIPSVRNNPFKQQDPKPSFKAGKSKATAGLPPAGLPTGETAKVDAATSNIEKLLKWIQKRVNQYPAVEVTNFTTSWEDGIAMCALMNYLLGDEVLDPSLVGDATVEERFSIALDAATAHGVPNILRADDLALNGANHTLDRRVMITFLHSVYTELFVKKKEEEKKKEEKME